MTRTEALQRLRAVGTLRGDVAIANSLQADDVNGPLAHAALRLADRRRSSAGGKQVLFPPAEFLPLLP